MQTEIESRDRQVQRLIEESLPLVQQVVHRTTAHFPRHVDKAELVQAGVIGLVQAAHRFDPGQGGAFTHFAAHRIRGAILDAARSGDWAPRSVRRAGRSIGAATEVLANRLGRVPTSAEIAESLGMTPQALTRLRDEVARSVVVGLHPTGSESDSDDDAEAVLRSTPADTALPPDEELCERELGAYLRDAVELLPERHRAIIQRYFFEGRTSEALATEFGVTVSRVSQLRKEAYEMLRHGLDAQYGEVSVKPNENQSKQVERRNDAYATAIATRSTWRTRLDG